MRLIEENRKFSNRLTCIWSLDFFHKDTNIIQERKGGLFYQWFWNNGYPHGKKLNLNPYLTLYTKINYKWFIDIKYKGQNNKTSRRKYRKSL